MNRQTPPLQAAQVAQAIPTIGESSLKSAIPPPPSPSPTIPTISKAERTGAISGFSIRSVHLKTEHQKRVKEVAIDTNALPREAFTQEAFGKYWEAYQNELLAKGERIQASILKMAQIELTGTAIQLTVSNVAAQTDILAMESKLLGYLHRALKNYDLSLTVKVNEMVAKKMLITPEEKYSQLLSENPLLQDFIQTFNLTIKS